MTSQKLSRRQILSGALFSTVGAIVLAACSSSGTPTAASTPQAAASSQTSPTAAPTSVMASSPTAASAVGASPTIAPAAVASPVAAKVTLTFSHWWGGQFDTETPVMQQKTGIGVQEEADPYNGHFQKLMTQLTAGTAPDFFLVDTAWNGAVFPSGLIVPYDDYLKTRKDVDPSKWDVDQLKENGYQGKIMGLSLFTGQDYIVHVNEELAQEAGVLKQAPLWGSQTFDTWHWDNFVEWLKAGTKVASDGTIQQAGLAGMGNVRDLLNPLAYQNGGAIFDDGVWNYSEKQAKLTSPECLAAGQLMADLLLKDKIMFPSGVVIPGGDPYRAKRAMATINWSTPSDYPEDLFKQTAFHVPFTDHKVHRLGANYWAVNKNSKQIQAAFEWTTTYLVDKDIRTMFLQISSVPAYDPLPIVQAAPEGRPKTIALINLSRIQGMSPLPADANGVALYPGWLGRDPQFDDDTLTAAMQSVWDGKQDVKTAFAQAEQKINADLATKK